MIPQNAKLPILLLAVVIVIALAYKPLQQSLRHDVRHDATVEKSEEQLWCVGLKKLFSCMHCMICKHARVT